MTAMERTSLSSRKLQNMASMDRLSSLPDEVLGHILSFLRTKKSVSTSVLARRWRFIWTNNVLNLDFSTSHNDTGTGFVDNVQRVVSLHKARRLNTFRLFCYMEDGSILDLETWIPTVIARNVVNIVITLHGYSNMLPQCLFASKTLVELRIYCHGVIPMAGTKYLPALKKLRLGYVYYESDESFTSLLSGCPVLEELTIKRVVMGPDMVCCSISSPTLIKLVLKFLPSLYLSNNKPFTLKIDTPALRFLKVQDGVSEDVSARALTSLTEAYIFDYSDGSALYSRSVFGFVAGLCNVKFLNLTTNFLEVPDSAFSALTMKYHNLTKVKLNTDCRFLPYFLTNAENLEVLTIEHVKRWMEPHQVPTCLLAHLKTVEIGWFGYTEDEFDMVRYILLNARVLKMMGIYFNPNRADAKEISIHGIKRISFFQRASQACEFAFREII